MERFLFLMSIGPVQSFIAAARKTEDLWAGSFLLSYLTEQVLKRAKEDEKRIVDFIYPHTNNEEREGGKKELMVASLPNRLLFQVTAESDAEMEQFGLSMEEEVRDTFLVLVDEAIHEIFSPLSPEELSYMIEMARKQSEEFLEIYWVYAPLKEDYQKTRKILEKELATKKNEKFFSLGEQKGLICTVCGSKEALRSSVIHGMESRRELRKKFHATWAKRSERYRQNSEEDERAIIRNDERLCSICLTKRNARFSLGRRKQHQPFPPFPSVTLLAGKKEANKGEEVDEGSYYAVIMMDGDDMGKWISGEKILTGKEVFDLSYHQELSKKLALFSSITVPEIIREYDGKLVYGGGDDLLAFGRLEDLFLLIQKLRESFSDHGRGFDEKATASMGVVIAYEKAPLKGVLQQVRRLEKMAKSFSRAVKKKGAEEPHFEEKDAFALGLYMRSGEKREVVLPWKLGNRQDPIGARTYTPEILAEVVEKLGTAISPTFLYRFAEAFSPLIGADLMEEKKLALPEEAIEMEMARLLARSVKEGVKENVETLAGGLMDIYRLTPSFLQFVHLLEILRFFAAQKKKENANGKGVKRNESAS